MSSRPWFPHPRLDYPTHRESPAGPRLTIRPRWQTLALSLLLAALPCFGQQVFDNTGNSMLDGDYFFRYVNWTGPGNASDEGICGRLDFFFECAFVR